MSNTVLAAIIVPIVVAVALAVWITAVYRADKNPRPVGSRSRGPRREVTGGSFRGTGGRQVMPLPDREPMTAGDQEIPDETDDADDADWRSTRASG
jgi:hypothetical protein